MGQATIVFRQLIAIRIYFFPIAHRNQPAVQLPHLSCHEPFGDTRFILHTPTSFLPIVYPIDVKMVDSKTPKLAVNNDRCMGVDLRFV